MASRVSPETSPASSRYTEVQFEVELDRKYVCPVCLSYLKDPMQTSCGHRFCKTCIMRVQRLTNGNNNEITKCPVDNNFIRVTTELFEDKAVQREVLSLTVYCDYRASECNWKGELRELPMHKESCKHRLVPCGNCLEEISIIDMTKHQVLKCPKFPVACMSCGEFGILRENMGVHTARCPDSTTPCPFRWLGCEYETKRKLMKYHNEEMCHAHLSLVVERLHHQQMTIDSLKSEVDMLRQATSFYPAESDEDDSHVQP